MIKLVDLTAQNNVIREPVFETLRELVSQNKFIGSDYLVKFEQDFAKFAKSEYFCGVSNGTTALELCLRSLGIGHEDEVITVANTFFATVEAIINVGAIPKFVDVEMKSGLMDIEKLRENLSDRTRAVIPVHLFGHLVDMPRLNSLIQNRSIFVIEDASQAHGTTHLGKHAGTFGDFGTFSFYPGKNLGAWGDAGGVISRNKTNFERLKMLRDHGRVGKYEHEIVGTNARMDPIQAVVLSEKIALLEQWNIHRKEVAANYLSGLGGKFEILKPSLEGSSSWHLFPIRVANRDELMAKMRDEGIETGIHYPIPLHRQRALEKFAVSQSSLPKTDSLCRQIVSLPIHGHLNLANQEKVISSFLRHARATEE